MKGFPADNRRKNVLFMGKIIPVNHDVQAFSEVKVYETTHDVKMTLEQMKLLQTYCVKQIYIRRAKNSEEFFKRIDNFDLVQMKSIINEHNGNNGKDGHFLVLDFEYFDETIIKTSEKCLILCPKDLGFINGLLTFIMGQDDASLQNIYRVTKQLRSKDERKPTPVTAEMKKPKVYVLIKNEEQPDESKRISDDAKKYFTFSV